jgi:cephalosporin hydroxylase
MSKLTELGNKYGTDKSTYHKFTDWYEEKLKIINPKKILEIGVKNGSSLKMWRDFYQNSIVIGIDINEPIVIENSICLKGDGSNENVINDFFYGMKFDLIIDDGSHKTSHQLKSFNLLFDNYLNNGGIYIIEDLHTSFLSEYRDTPISTYDWLINSGLNYEIYQRDKSLFHDSMTSIIYKK